MVETILHKLPLSFQYSKHAEFQFTELKHLDPLTAQVILQLTFDTNC